MGGIIGGRVEGNEPLYFFISRSSHVVCLQSHPLDQLGGGSSKEGWKEMYTVFQKQPHCMPTDTPSGPTKRGVIGGRVEGLVHSTYSSQAAATLPKVTIGAVVLLFSGSGVWNN